MASLNYIIVGIICVTLLLVVWFYNKENMLDSQPHMLWITPSLTDRDNHAAAENACNPKTEDAMEDVLRSREGASGCPGYMMDADCKFLSENRKRQLISSEINGLLGTCGKDVSELNMDQYNLPQLDEFQYDQILASMEQENMENQCDMPPRPKVISAKMAKLINSCAENNPVEVDEYSEDSFAEDACDMPPRQKVISPKMAKLIDNCSAANTDPAERENIEFNPFDAPALRQYPVQNQNQEGLCKNPYDDAAGRAQFPVIYNWNDPNPINIAPKCMNKSGEHPARYVENLMPSRYS
jgi:hypothetical protein